jgi:hypothetical protein
MEPLALLGPLDALGTNVQYLVLALVLVNAGTRARAHSRHSRQAETDGPEAVERDTLHEATNVLLVVSSLYWITVAYHGGIVMSVLVIGLVVTDFFEFEARKVEARKGDPLDAPKGALTAWGLVLLYAAYQTLFFLVADIWNGII